MKENEKAARIILDASIACGDVSLGTSLAASMIRRLGGLTDKQCANIALNYPYSWRAIQSMFREARAKRLETTLGPF